MEDGRVRYWRDLISSMFYRVMDTRQSLALLDNFIKVPFGFGLGFRQSRYFFWFGGIRYTSLI